MVRAVALGVAAFLTALPGVAQERTSGLVQSPRSGSVELRFGSWRPDNIDAGVKDSPFTKIYGSGNLLLFEGEFHRFFYQGIGTAGVSLTLGYAEKYGNTLREVDREPSEERTGFHVLPLHVRGVYRFDYPAFKWRIPVVPYLKPGIVVIPWWVTKGGQIEVTDKKTEGRGTSVGLDMTAGVSLLLDVLEPRLARDFDADLGINHSYLFAEYTYSKVNNFGRGGFDLSDAYWMFGLALDY